MNKMLRRAAATWITPLLAGFAGGAVLILTNTPL